VTNKNLRRVAAASLMTAGALVSGAAIAEANATSTATATVIAPIAISATNMAIGQLIAGNGTVTLNTNGSRTNNTAVALPTGVSSAAGVFSITGSGSNTFAIAYNAPISLTGTGTADGSTMPVDFITETTSGTAAAAGKTTTGRAATGALNAGSARIYAGAIVTVDPTQAAGSYSGNLVVTVAYN
jgi:hypothetical protein